MIVELISVGTELLLGNIVNTNAQYLSETCAKLGLNVYYQTTVTAPSATVLSCTISDSVAPPAALPPPHPREAIAAIRITARTPITIKRICVISRRFLLFFL